MSSNELYHMFTTWCCLLYWVFDYSFRHECYLKNESSLMTLCSLSLCCSSHWWERYTNTLQQILSNFNFQITIVAMFEYNFFKPKESPKLRFFLLFKMDISTAVCKVEAWVVEHQFQQYVQNVNKKWLWLWDVDTRTFHIWSTDSKYSIL